MNDIHGGNIWEASRKTGLSAQELIDFSSSINPAGLPPKSASAVKNALRYASIYPDPGALELKDALASYHAISPLEILPGNGSTEFIYLIPRIFKPERALIVEPAFSEYRRSLKVAGCRIESFILKDKDGFSLPDTETLMKAVKKKDADIVYIGNPSNPVGALAQKNALIELALYCRRRGTVLVVDEAFADFAESESLKNEVRRLSNLVVLRSMTKFFSMAGLRLGYLVASGQVIKRFSELIPPWSVNTLASAAGIEALKDTAYMDKTYRWFKKEKGFLFRALSGIEGLKVYPTSANFFMIRISRRSVSAVSLKERLLKKGILIRELSGFRGLGPRYFRVAVKRRSENELLVKALSDALGNR